MAATFHLFTSLRCDPNLRQVPASKLDHAGWNYHNESPFYMLDLHRDRVLRAAKHWDWAKVVGALEGETGLRTLSEFLTSSLVPARAAPLRVKLTVTEEGELGCEWSVVPVTPLENLLPRQLPVPGAEVENGSGLPSKEVAYEVVLDSGRTQRSEYTHFKTSQRGMYHEARQRAGIKLGDNKEVLIVEADGRIMEGSTTTPYFWRNGRWVTPPVAPRFSSADGSGGNDGTTRRWALER